MIIACNLLAKGVPRLAPRFGKLSAIKKIKLHNSAVDSESEEARESTAQYGFTQTVVGSTCAAVPGPTSRRRIEQRAHAAATCVAIVGHHCTTQARVAATHEITGDAPAAIL